MNYDSSYINKYCVEHGFPLPLFIEGEPVVKQAAAECLPEEWGMVLNQGLGEIGERTLLHELAHLIVRQDDRGDSITHGPKFRAKELEIENWIRDERRKDIRARKKARPSVVK